MVVNCGRILGMTFCVVVVVAVCRLLWLFFVVILKSNMKTI